MSHILIETSDMPVDSRLHRAADLTLTIERAMRDGGYWHDQAPKPAAMASRTPFCADTLVFTEWLQFLFIPKMRALIERGGPLPQQSAIAVMATQKLEDRPGRAELMAQLETFDALLQDEQP